MDDLSRKQHGDTRRDSDGQVTLKSTTSEHHSPLANRASGLSKTRPQNYLEEEPSQKQLEIDTEVASPFTVLLEETKFQVGYSPFEYAEKRQLVLEELGQPGHQRRGVRSIWEALKSKGCHIKPDFVEKVIKHAQMTSKSIHSPEVDYEPRIGTKSIHPGAVHVPITTAMTPALDPFDDKPLNLERKRMDNPREEFDINQREYLTNVVNNLLSSLKKWCSLPLQHTGTETSIMRPQVPAEIAVSGGSSGPPKSSDRENRRPYVPEYTKTEEQVAHETLGIALALQRTLSCAKSSKNLLSVADQLREMRARLQDIGMPNNCLAEVGLGDLQVIEITSHAYGRQEWILRELWHCAADCVYELGAAGQAYAPDRRYAADKVTDATRDLASICPNHADFFLATSLHYEAVYLFEAGQVEEAIDALNQSVDLFGDALSPNQNYERIREVNRALLSYSRVKGVPHEDAEVKTTFANIFSQPRAVTNDPVQAELLVELADAVFENWQGSNGDPPSLCNNALSRTAEAIHILRLFRTARPSRVQPVLTRALRIYAEGLRIYREYSTARKALEEAITIQRRLTRYNVDGVPYLVFLMDTYVASELHIRQQKGEPPIVQHSVAFLGPRFGPDVTAALRECLDFLPYHLQFIRNPLTLTVLCGLTDIVHPIIRSHQAATLVPAVVRVMLTISDLHRGLGAFDTALDASREALTIATKARAIDEIPGETYIDVVICHAYSLVDNDAYEEARASLQEIQLIWERSPGFKRYFSDSWESWAGLFSVVSVHLCQTSGALSCLDDVIGASRSFTEYPSASRLPPCWLCSVPGISEGGSAEALSWLLLIQTVIRYHTSPAVAMRSAEESLGLLIEYYHEVGGNMEPYARASVLGNEYILLCILGDVEHGKSVLKESVSIYRSVLDTEPQMARLPLLVFLNMALVLSRCLPTLKFAIHDLSTWKQSVYKGSTSFFKHFVTFLEDLPHNIQIHSDAELSSRSWPVLEVSYGISQADVPGTAQIDQNEPGGQMSRERSGEISYLDDVEAIRPSRGSASPVANVLVDLTGKTVHFSNQHIESLVPTIPPPHIPKSNADRVPNLTGRIKIVKGPLCAGGFCDIYSGELVSERGVEQVAMKMLRVFNTEAHIVQAKKKFRREVNLWCSLRHLYVLPFFGTCEFDEFRLFMVSPWAEGGNSLEYLRRNPFADRGQLLWQTASALEYLHSGQDAPRVVHGDLKADNVLISAKGDALLCDFGLSRHVEEIVSKSGSSSAGRAGGHARFMAPELLIPPKDATQATRPTPGSDVFAFASLMLQIYTEKLPFGDFLEAQAILKLANGDLPLRPVEPIVLERGCDHRIWTLMTQCWQFEPCKRPCMAEAYIGFGQWIFEEKQGL